MIISLFTNNGALNSPPIFRSLEIGLSKLGHTVLYNNFDADVYVLWSMLLKGRMAKNRDAWVYSSIHNIPVIVLEVSAIKRNVLWRVGINGLTLPSNIFQPNRASYLNVQLQDWKKVGNHVLICGQHHYSLLWKHCDYMEWLTNTIETIRKYTDRKIVYRPHPRNNTPYDFSNLGVTVHNPIHIPSTYDEFDFNNSLNDAWIVVNSSSSPAIQALINGVPVITDEHSVAHSLSTPIADIEHPCYDSRTEWLTRICHMEWYPHELEDPKILSNILVAIIE